MNMEDLYRLLRAGHVQAQGIVDTIADPLLVLDASLRVQNASRSFFSTFHVERDDTIGQPLYSLGNGQWNSPELRRLLEEVIPKSSAVIDYEVEHDFPTLGRRTMLVTARKLHHPDDGSHSMLLVITDATERYRRDAVREMLFRELKHRVKNLLAVTQSIARQTSTENRSAEAFRDDFLGRFAALVAAHELGFSPEAGTDIGTLVERILAPYGGESGAIVVEGSQRVVLTPSTVMSLSLVLHELATNASKHGALSVDEGIVRVSWDVQPQTGALHIGWRESGGPPVSPPATLGYGTHLIESVTTYSLGGEITQTYEPSGLRTEITLPLGKVSRGAAPG